MTWTYTDFVEALESSSIDKMWYNHNTEELATEYARGYTVYGHRGVGPGIWAELRRQAQIRSGSVGQYHAGFVKGKFDTFTPEENNYYDTDRQKFNLVSRVVENSPPTLGEGLQEYVFNGTTSFTKTIKANSLDEASAAMHGYDAEAKITSVTINFDE